MELLQLQYFLTVARSEHMTRAAKALGIAQPALSQTIARLEQELGVALFDRVGRTIRLNHFGRSYAQHVERIFAELEQGQRDLTELADGRQGQVAIALSVATHMIPELLRIFRQAHPGIQFRLTQHRSTLRGDLVEQLVQGAYDLYISSPPLQQPGITSVALLTEDILLAVPATHPFAERAHLRLQEVAHEAFISLTSGHSLRDLTDNFCQQAGFRPRIVFESDEPSTIRGLIRAELGIAFVPAVSWRGSVGSAIKHISVTDPICQRTIGLAWGTGHPLSVASQQFRAFLIDYFAQLAPA